ncbi:hypothetical protein LY76DRAFT_136622 [Colletotrichum caudatum]|nr:hypothetical protein LY76DRAFT_136622 [Colletotrichum caudatum]
MRTWVARRRKPALPSATIIGSFPPRGPGANAGDNKPPRRGASTGTNRERAKVKLPDALATTAEFQTAPVCD